MSSRCLGKGPRFVSFVSGEVRALLTLNVMSRLITPLPALYRMSLHIKHIRRIIGHSMIASLVLDPLQHPLTEHVGGRASKLPTVGDARRMRESPKRYAQIYAAETRVRVHAGLSCGECPTSPSAITAQSSELPP